MDTVFAFAWHFWVLLAAASGITAVGVGGRPTRAIAKGKRTVLWVTLFSAAVAFLVGAISSQYILMAGATAVLLVAVVGHSIVCGWYLGQVARVMRPHASVWGSLVVCTVAAVGLAGLVAWRGLLILPVVSLGMGFCGLVLLANGASSSRWLAATVVAGTLGCLLVDLLVLERVESMLWPRAFTGMLLAVLSTAFAVRIYCVPEDGAAGSEREEPAST